MYKSQFLQVFIIICTRRKFNTVKIAKKIANISNLNMKIIGDFKIPTNINAIPLPKITFVINLEIFVFVKPKKLSNKTEL